MLSVLKVKRSNTYGKHMRVWGYLLIYSIHMLNAALACHALKSVGTVQICNENDQDQHSLMLW